MTAKVPSLFEKCVLWWPGEHVGVTNTAKSIAAAGNATQVTTITDPWGLTRPVGYFDGSGDYLTCGVAADWALGTTDFTFEGWIYLTASRTYEPLFSNGMFADLVPGMWASVGGFAGFQCNIESSWISSNYPFTQTLGVWHHWALVRSGSGTNNVTFYWDGIAIKQGTSTASITSPYAMRVGHYGPSSGYGGTNSYMSEFRISTTARYKSNFTPPTSRFKPDQYTKLLLHMYGSGQTFVDDPFVDYSEFPILPTGVTVTPSGTFYKEALPNGKQVIKFDGSTNYLSLTDNDAWTLFGVDFTMCLWVRFSSTSRSIEIIGQYVDASNGWVIDWVTSNLIEVFSRVTSINTYYKCPFTPSANAWYHITIMRSGSSCLIYINGVSISVTIETAWGSTTNFGAPLKIGYGTTGSYTMLGNIKDLLIFKNKALSRTEIQELMTLTNPSSGPGLIDSLYDYWRLS